MVVDEDGVEEEEEEIDTVVPPVKVVQRLTIAGCTQLRRAGLKRQGGEG